MHPVFCIASLGNKGRPFQTSLQFPWQNKKFFFSVKSLWKIIKYYAIRDAILLPFNDFLF